MTQSHSRSRPKSNDESEQERVAHELVKKASLENQVCIFPALLKKIYLPDSEKVEVIDYERAQQHEQPAGPKQRVEYKTADGIRHAPNHAQHRTPLPEQQNQQQAREEDIRAPFDRLPA